MLPLRREYHRCSDRTALWNERRGEHRADRPKLRHQFVCRYRFERAFDPAFMVPGSNSPPTCVLEMCGGSPSENVVIASFGADSRVNRIFSAERSNGSPRSMCPEFEDEAYPRPSRLQWSPVSRPGCEDRGSVLAHRLEGKADSSRRSCASSGSKGPMTPFDLSRRPNRVKPVSDPESSFEPARQRALAARSWWQAVRGRSSRNSAAELYGYCGGRDRPSWRARQPDRLRPARYGARPAS